MQMQMMSKFKVAYFQLVSRWMFYNYHHTIIVERDDIDFIES
jgi:hypothetical protein